MVPAVIDGCACDGQGIPEPGNREVGAQEERSCHNGAKVDHYVLDGMGIHRSDSDRRDPFVVSFVDALVEKGMMHESERGRVTIWQTLLLSFYKYTMHHPTGTTSTQVLPYLRMYANL